MSSRTVKVIICGEHQGQDTAHCPFCKLEEQDAEIARLKTLLSAFETECEDDAARLVVHHLQEMIDEEKTATLCGLRTAINIFEKDPNEAIREALKELEQNKVNRIRKTILPNIMEDVK